MLVDYDPIRLVMKSEVERRMGQLNQYELLQKFQAEVRLADETTENAKECYTEWRINFSGIEEKRGTHVLIFGRGFPKRSASANVGTNGTLSREKWKRTEK